jgi:tRNA(Ile)-lysidine synthase
VVGELAPDTVEKSPENLEARARRARYAFLERVRDAVGARAICVAHTRDDQAETVLLRLGRGAGPRALAAMAPRRGDGVVRPLLERSRAECAAYLRATGVVSVHDTSNDDTRRMRSRARHVVLPALEGWLEVDVRARLARLARDLRVESDLAERYLEGLLPAAGTRPALPIASVLAAGEAAPRLVHAWLGRLGVAAGERQVGAIVRIARGGSPSASVDLAGWRLERRYDALEASPVGGGASVARSAATAWAPIRVGVPEAAILPNGWRLSTDWLEAGANAASASLGPLQVVLSARAVGLPLVARAPRPGDRIRLGRGRRKLSDVLIDARVPRRERPGLFVVTDMDDTVVWIPGVTASPWAIASGLEGRRIAVTAERRPARSASGIAPGGIAIAGPR